MSANRRLAGRLIGILVLVGLALGAWTLLKPPPDYRNDNLIFIVLDTTRADKLQTYGYDRRKTSPNIDDFADKSAVFEMALTHSPWTKPSVASMFTSLTPRDHGIFDWPMKLDESLLTLPKHLDAQGFHTQAHISHRAFRTKDTNFKLGFDKYDISVLKKGSPHKVTSSEEITDAGIRFLRNGSDQRFFLWLHYFDPHTDYIRHDQFDFGKGLKARYDSEIAFMDHHLGRLFSALEDGDYQENTIVVLVADHGEGLGDHSIRKHTKALYQQQLHVPLIIRVPGMTGARHSETVPLIDLAPTLTELLGLPLPEQFMGKPIPYANGFTPLTDRTVISETRRFADLRSVVRRGWKLLVDLESDDQLLYHIAEDPLERVNLSEAEPERLAELNAALEAYHAVADRKVETEALSADMQQALESLGYME